MEYAIKGKTRVVFLDYQTKTPILYLPNVFMGHVEVEGVHRTTSGGEQGLDFLGWNRNAGDSFILYTSLFSMKFLEMTAGSLLEEKQEIIKEIQHFELNEATDEIELDYTPLKIEKTFVYQLNSSGRYIEKQININTISDNNLTLEENVDHSVVVIYDTLANVEKVDIGKFLNKGFISIVGDTDIYNRDTGEKEKLYFEFPKININNSFNVKMLNSDEQMNQMFTMECQALVEEKIGKSLVRIIKRIDEEE